MIRLFTPIWAKNKEALNDIMLIDTKVQQVTKCKYITKGIHFNSDIPFCMESIEVLQHRFDLAYKYKHPAYQYDMGMSKEQLREQLLDSYTRSIHIFRCNLINLLFSEN
jgi:hypothetical protein